MLESIERRNTDFIGTLLSHCPQVFVESLEKIFKQQGHEAASQLQALISVIIAIIDLRSSEKKRFTTLVFDSKCRCLLCKTSEE